MTEPFDPNDPADNESGNTPAHPHRPQPAKESLGKRIRDMVEGALNCDERRDIQRDILNQIFFEISIILPHRMEDEFMQAFNRAAQMQDEDRNPSIVESLTTPPPDGYSPVKKFGLGFSNMYTDFKIDDFIDLPGYVRLHEVAREMDVSISLLNVTEEEAKGGGNPLFPGQPLLVANGMESYEDGWYKNRAIYPKLPPVEPPKLLLPPKKPKQGGNLNI